MKQTAGFTVIELLIVSAIIGMLAAVLVPNLLSETAGYEPCTLVQVFQTCAVTKN